MCFYDAPSLKSAGHMTEAVVKVLVFTGHVCVHLILKKSLKIFHLPSSIFPNAFYKQELGFLV